MPPRAVAVLLLLGASVAPAQLANDYLYPIREGRKFGFINRAGTVIVAPRYDAVGELKEGRIRVTSGSLSGYIDLSGKVVIEPRYDTAGEFRDSRAVVRRGNQYALNRSSGTLIADIAYRVLGGFHPGAPARPGFRPHR